MSKPEIAERSLYFTADYQRVVEHGDQAAAFLACPAGRRVPRSVAAIMAAQEDPEPAAASDDPVPALEQPATAKPVAAKATKKKTARRRKSKS